MSKMRPESGKVFEGSFRGELVKDRLEVLRLIAKAVNRRRTLIRGKLDDRNGKHCAIGCLFADHKKIGIPTLIADEVAAVNDKLSDRADPKTRWKAVKRWLQKEIAKLETSAVRTKGESR